MTVRANVAFGLKMQGVGKAERAPRPRRRTAGDARHRRPGRPEPGEPLGRAATARVGLARALAVEPNVLLLDEPMTGLDAKLKDRLQRDRIAPVGPGHDVAVRHSRPGGEAMRMCDRIAVMNDGSVEQVGSPAEVYEEPATPFVADFVGTSNLLSATAVDGTLDFGFGAVDADVPMDLCGEVTVSARPSDFEMGGGRPGGRRGRRRLPRRDQTNRGNAPGRPVRDAGEHEQDHHGGSGRHRLGGPRRQWRPRHRPRRPERELMSRNRPPTDDRQVGPTVLDGRRPSRDSTALGHRSRHGSPSSPTPTSPRRRRGPGRCSTVPSGTSSAPSRRWRTGTSTAWSSRAT